MSKTLISVLVVGVVVVGGYLALNKNKVSTDTQKEASNTETDTKTAEQPAGKKMAFSEFVKTGGSYKCEVKQYLSDMNNSGTVYINGGNISGEYTTVAEGRTIDTSFIMKDGYSYTWSSMFPSMGFKIKVNTSAAGANANASASGTYSWNANQIGDYNCEAWTLDASKFALPANITFKDMSPK